MEGTRGRFPETAVCTSRRKPFASWIIFDTEATGFKLRPGITELCMLAVLTDELKSTSRLTPRVINKLQLCFNPESAIRAEASRLTGLYNDVLEQMATFRDQAPLITGFLASLPQPVCIIAHNGHRFDFTLLQSEFHKANHPLPAGAQIYCADSLEAFRVLDGLPAVPEWMVQRQQEEAQRKALAQKSVRSSAQKTDSTYSAVAPKATSDCGQDEDCSSGAESRSISSPTKRLINCTDFSEDAGIISKLTKTDTGTPFGSQSSVTDSDLAAAYDAAIGQADIEDDTDGHVSPVPAVVDSSLQSQQETTPVKNPSWTNTGPLPGKVVKKPPPLSVRSSQAGRVVKRLFDEEPVTSKGESFQGALKNNPFQKNRLDNGHTVQDAAASDVISSQGSLPDEKIVQMVEKAESEAVTSPLSFGCGAGESVVVSQDKGAESVKNQNRTLLEDPQPSSFQDQVEEGSRNPVNIPIKSQLPTETGWDLSKSSKQNQVSEVTSSASIAAQTIYKPSASAHSAQGAPSRQSYRLVEIYKRQFGRYPDTAHNAEDDCVTLLKIIVSRRSDFMAFVEDHAVSFDDVKLMY